MLNMENAKIIKDFFISLMDIIKKQGLKGVLLPLVLFFVAILIVFWLLKKITMIVLEKIDMKIDYSKKNIKLEYREDLQRKERYYGIDYWIWQKNKIAYLNEIYKEGVELNNGKIISDICLYSKVVNKFFSEGERIAKYKTEMRIYVVSNSTRPISVTGDYIYGDKVGRDKITNDGIQVINIKNEFPNEVINILSELINNQKISLEDRVMIEKCFEKITSNEYSEKENKSLLTVLSKYVQDIANVATVIEFLRNLLFH